MATYLFSATGRTVENHIEAYFRFADGKIIEHHDHFDLWRWMRQALGAKGLLLGWLAPVQAVVSVSGSPVTPEPAASNGFKIERNFFTLDGKPADVSKAKQNDRFAVVLKVTEAKPEFGRIMVVDYLPAGLEIDNPKLVSSGDSGTLDWIEDGEEPENTEFRDDRFSAAIEREAKDEAVFTVAYIVRAVSPGKYVLPQAYVEDMYNPSRYGRTATGAIEVRAAK